MTTKNYKSPSNSQQSEIEALKAKIAMLEKQQEKAPEDDYVEDRIQLEDYVPVMSLLPYTLNLSTRAAGQGVTKKFTKFGEVKRILYKDLVEIMEVHSNFVEAGYFYIMNPTLIRQHGLNDAYSKILTKDKIEEILSTNSEESVNLYNSANEKQQEVIIELLIEKVRDNPDSVNLNIIDKISRISKIDIAKKAEESKVVEEAEVA